MIYNVEITETLQRTLSIEATSADEAEDKVRKLYRSAEVVLDYRDYIDTEFCVVENGAN